MKVIQLSTSTCGYCPPATNYARSNMPLEDYILVILDTGQIVYDGNETQEEVEGAVNAALEQAARPRGVPAFRVLDNDNKLVDTPQGVREAIKVYDTYKANYVDIEDIETVPLIIEEE